MKLTFSLLVIVLLAGCSALSHEVKGRHGIPPLIEAKERMEAGELYRARKLTEKELAKQPNNLEANNLMAQIIDAELARYKELFDTKAIEELEPDEKDIAVDTWLERSRTLLQSKLYEEALLAAEKVFLYDAENTKASQLIDDIRAQAVKDGKQEILVRNEMVRSEIRDRVMQYRKQAREAIQQKQWGRAKFATQKLLLLEPEDEEGLKLQKLVQAHN
jgi:hypothetical protein